MQEAYVVEQIPKIWSKSQDYRHHKLHHLSSRHKPFKIDWVEQDKRLKEREGEPERVRQRD